METIALTIEKLHGMGLDDAQFHHELIKTLADMQQTELTNIQEANKTTIEGGAEAPTT